MNKKALVGMGIFGIITILIIAGFLFLGSSRKIEEVSARCSPAIIWSGCDPIVGGFYCWKALNPDCTTDYACMRYSGCDLAGKI